MAGFLGGSAYAMSREIGAGYHIVSERTFKAMSLPDLDKLAFELDRHMKEVRGDQPPLDDLQAIQHRNRKISRINNALMILRHYKSRVARPKLQKPGARQKRRY